jgi:ABC-type antimicrobial peptide transport system permease subunit
VFYLKYMLSELRRRRGRTLLTALGLAVGVGLVVTVTALSTGLDRAQKEVLEPLTGVGTDLSVSRPIEISSTEGGPGGFGLGNLSEEEQRQLQEENGDARIGLQNLGEPGERFSRDSFLATSQLSFPTSEVDEISRLSGVSSAAGGLTLNAVHIEGVVPENAGGEPGFGQPPTDQGVQGPENLDFNSITVSGVDQRHKDLGAVTSSQISTGRYFSNSETSRETILNESYAKRQSIAVGGTITLGGKKFEVVGLADTPLGGQASDVYVKLTQLQELSGREDRVNTVYVRATSSDEVASVSRSIEGTFEGASATTAQELADRVSGSLVDAKNLTSKIGTALAVVGLLAAFLIASLLTLSSVTKRIRELGTLKALGWSQRLVVRQVTGESLLQGLFGGLLGVALGLAGAALVSVFSPTLEASVAETTSQGAGPFAAFGQGAVQAGSTTVELDAPVGVGLIALAVALALVGGLVSGAVGGLRAARLRPADALRHLD